MFELVNSIDKLLMLFNKREKKNLLILFVMMVVAAIFETAGVGAILPFVGILTNPSIIQENSILAYIYNLFDFNSSKTFIVFTGAILLGIFIIKNIYLLFFNYFQIRLVLNQQVRLSSKLFRRYLTKPYTFHLERNTSELLRNVNGEVNKVFQGIVISGFQLITEVLVTLLILLLLITTSPAATIIASTLLGGSVFLFFKLFRKRINLLGQEQQKVNAEMIKWVNQGLGASKEVKVSGKESFFIDAYTFHYEISSRNSRQIGMLHQIPRLFIETLLVCIVLISMLIITYQGINTSELVSTMALFTMAAFRLMPSITRIVALITTIRYNQPALTIIHNDLFVDTEQNQSNNSTPKVLLNKSEKYFKDNIKLTDVSFRYPNQKKYSVKDISLCIPIGKSVAFIGESGAGKSTIVDIIIGLFKPQKGQVIIDGESLDDQEMIWKQKIGYIPQSIFLSDDTIRKNIAFGINDELIDDEAVWTSLEKAQLKEFVETLPEKLDTKVGERGVRLSGGQRQRIGIARALYPNPEIIFMDEATSALDNETETEIMKAIDQLKGDKTLIIIAHRLSTIENCDLVFKINKGRLVEVENRFNKYASAR